MNRLEVFYGKGDRPWRAQRHCDCGSTFSSDDCATADGACVLAIDALYEHMERYGAGMRGSSCGTRNHAEPSCNCDECREHDRKLGALVKR